MNLILAAIVFVILIIVLLVNILIYKFIINEAKRKFIKPFLVQKGFSVVEIKFSGLLNTGDFSEKMFTLEGFMQGNPLQTTYVYVFYTSGNDKQTRRMTARIKSLFLSVRAVDYLPKILET